MRFPLVILDFEASSLNMESYPIEVGLAVATGPKAPISVWSSLILPDEEWLESGDWESAAEQVHGITRASLQTGMAARNVAEGLNRVISSIDHCWCDGGRYDGHWLKTLFRAAGIKPAFQLWDIAGLFLLDGPLRDRFTQIISQDTAPHRAGADALRLCSALVRAAGGEPGAVVSPIAIVELAAFLEKSCRS